MFSNKCNSTWAAQQRRKIIDIHGCTNRALNPKELFFMFHISMSANIIMLGDSTVMKRWDTVIKPAYSLLESDAIHF